MSVSIRWSGLVPCALLGCPAEFTSAENPLSDGQVAVNDAEVDDTGQAGASDASWDTSVLDSAVTETTTDVVVDGGSGFVSTPRAVDCDGYTVKPYDTPTACCPYMGRWVANAGGCPSDLRRWDCEEKADCPSPQICCASVEGGALCMSASCGKRYCMTNSECPSGKCVASYDGPGKTPHGVCAP